MGNNTILSVLWVTALVTVLFGLVANTADEVRTNPYLDNDSSANLNNLLIQYNEVQITNITMSNVTENSTFEGTDAFQREFLESKAVSSGNKSAIQKIIGVPDLLLLSAGIEQDNTVKAIIVVFAFMIAILIGLIIYKAWKTGQVD